MATKEQLIETLKNARAFIAGGKINAVEYIEIIADIDRVLGK